jgi:Domain of unknown function (DUF1841)
MSFFANQSREQLRTTWRTAWARRLSGLPLEPLQAQIADVIEAHPEYQAFIASEAVLQQEFTPVEGRENPFLHMGLHLAIHEQVGTDRPAGIRALHERLTRRSGSAHEAEHQMIEILATALWEAQRAGRAPDEAAYLERLQRL